MKSIFITSLIILFTTSYNYGQWSKKQLEVWETVKEYSKAESDRDLEKYLKYWHHDFIGWHQGWENPTNYQERVEGLKIYFSATESVMYELEPLNIKVLGEVAIVQYKNRMVVQTKKSGEEEYSISKWTDILVREKGEWSLISDHGM